MSKGYMFYDDEIANNQQYICEIAYLLTDVEGNPIGEPACQRINPEGIFGYWYVKTHHITADSVKDCPTMEQFCEESSFLQDLSEYTLVAHNAKGADIHHIEKSLAHYGIPMPELEFIDTREMASTILPPGERSLRGVCRHYGVQLQTHHNALADAIACKEIFARMLQEGIEPVPEVPSDSPSPSRRHRNGVRILGQGTLFGSSKTVDEAMAEVKAAGLRGDLDSIERFENLVVVVSGHVPGYRNRGILSEELEHYGAKVVSGRVPGYADLLVIGNNASQDRIDGAIGLGIPVFTAGDLLQFIDNLGTQKEVESDAPDDDAGGGNTCLENKSFSFATGLAILDPFEGYQLITERGGVPHEIKSNTSVSSDTDYFVIPDELARGAKRAVYVDNARSKGVNIISEAEFWRMIGIQLAPDGIADHWVIVDDSLSDGKVDVSNQPAWDGSVAPYKLFIQHGTAKSTHAGGWRVVACGFLTDEETTDEPHYGKAVSVKKDAIQWTHWGNPQLGGDFSGVGANIGKVVIRDHYVPQSCKYLFDGLQRCSEFDIPGLDTSKCTDMKGMFRGCASVKYFMSTDRFKTESVTDMSEMFFGCLNAQVINCIGWDLSKVTTMRMMFENSPAAALFDDGNVPIPDSVDSSRMFDTTPKHGKWLRRA